MYRYHLYTVGTYPVTQSKYCNLNTKLKYLQISWRFIEVKNQGYLGLFTHRHGDPVVGLPGGGQVHRDYQEPANHNLDEKWINQWENR